MDVVRLLGAVGRAVELTLQRLLLALEQVGLLLEGGEGGVVGLRDLLKLFDLGLVLALLAVKVGDRGLDAGGGEERSLAEASDLVLEVPVLLRKLANLTRRGVRGRRWISWPPQILRSPAPRTPPRGWRASPQPPCRAEPPAASCASRGCGGCTPQAAQTIRAEAAGRSSSKSARKKKKGGRGFDIDSDILRKIRKAKVVRKGNLLSELENADEDANRRSKEYLKTGDFKNFIKESLDDVRLSRGDLNELVESCDPDATGKVKYEKFVAAVDK